MNDKNKHVTPPAIFILEKKIQEQQKEIDSLKAQNKKLKGALECISSISYIEFRENKDYWRNTVVGVARESLEEKEGAE